MEGNREKQIMVNLEKFLVNLEENSDKNIVIILKTIFSLNCLTVIWALSIDFEQKSTLAMHYFRIMWYQWCLDKKALPAQEPHNSSDILLSWTFTKRHFSRTPRLLFLRSFMNRVREPLNITFTYYYLYLLMREYISQRR